MSKLDRRSMRIQETSNQAAYEAMVKARRTLDETIEQYELINIDGPTKADELTDQVAQLKLALQITREAYLSDRQDEKTRAKIERFRGLL